jgi:hypothetical protein
VHFLRSIQKQGTGRVRRLVQRWGFAVVAAGLLAFSLASLGTGNASVPVSGPVGGYQVSFQANNMLYGYTSSGPKSATTLGMQADTSLASVRLSNGTFESAFQGKDHDLYLYRWDGTKIRTTLRMAPGTSPALAGLPTDAGWVAAFQASNHNLYIYTSYGIKIDTNMRMKPGTSPAIASQPNDAWEVAITGHNGKLNTYNSASNGLWTSNAMDTASSPSIAALPDGSYQVAFEASNNSLDIYHTDGADGTTGHTGFRMDPRTSPSIASQPDGDWQVAFQAKDHELDTADSVGNSRKTTDGMQAGTSPSVTSEPDGSCEMAFEAKNNSLDIYHTGGTTDHTGFRMDPGTSPSAPITTPTLPTALASSPGSEIVSIAESQLGYQDIPAGSYCNPYTAHWAAGKSSSCGKGKSSEEWCADFAAWVWHQAGVPFTYGFGSGQINAGAVSFYQWGEANGTWHAAGSGYTPQPGDVVIYGLNTPTDTTADHVAIVTGGTARDPAVIDGDWWNSGNGSVAAATDQTTATGTDTISGYISPWRTPSSEEKRLPLRRKK